MTDTAGLRAWLQYLRLDKYFEILSASGHDAQSLARLSDAELSGLGLPLGPRKKIQLNAGLILQSCRGASGIAAPDDDEAQARNTQGSRLPVLVSKLCRSSPLPPASAAAATLAPTTGSSQPTGVGDVRAVHPVQAQFASVETGVEGVNSTYLTGQRTHPSSHGPKQPHEPQLASGATLLSSVTGIGVIPNTHCHAVPPGNHQANGRSVRHSQQQREQPGRTAHVSVRTSDPWVCDTTGVSARAPEPQGSLVHSMSGTNHLPTPLKQQDEGENPQRQRKLNSAADACCVSCAAHAAIQPPHVPSLLMPGFGVAAITSDVGGPKASSGLAKSSPPRPTSVPTVAGCPPPSGKEMLPYGAAAAERWALAQLYPSVDHLRYARTPGTDTGLRTLGDVGTSLGSSTDGACVSGNGAAGNGDFTVVAGWLDSTRRGVLKRSRSWDGRTGSDWAAEAPGLGMQNPRPQYVQNKSTETRRQWRRNRWADGQLLYNVAASALPVDCSFRPLRNATTTAAAAAAAATTDGPSASGTGDSRTAPQAYTSTSSRADVASVTVQAAAATAGENNVVKVSTCAALSRPLYATVATAGVGDDDPDAAKLRYTQNIHENGSLTDVVAGGMADATSLLDDPRNYETPELLAQLLYDNALDAPRSIDATGLRAGSGQPAAPEQPPGNGMLRGSLGRVPGEGVDFSGCVRALDTEGSGLLVSREQRLARLRALREEVTATERLLETLRRMVAEEEEALSSTTVGNGSSGGCGSGVAPHRHAATARQAHDEVHPHVQSYGRGMELSSEQGDGLGFAQRMPPGLALVPGDSRGTVRGPAPDREPEDLPTQRWDSGTILAERLDILG
ncbi:hypothetical protein Vafri_19547 [Volvox africanus]|uniref:SAM domain-containing protein n=1 Tax=Volvox africanus TaxID=51714 RepID=A0A8J4BV01_9CHLO|nr:hypothetical protein Vafri_19547 [Volvox africanus]